jgi:hypothetical protein
VLYIVGRWYRVEVRVERYPRFRTPIHGIKQTKVRYLDTEELKCRDIFDPAYCEGLIADSPCRMCSRSKGGERLTESLISSEGCDDLG